MTVADLRSHAAMLYAQRDAAPRTAAPPASVRPGLRLSEIALLDAARDQRLGDETFLNTVWPMVRTAQLEIERRNPNGETTHQNADLDQAAFAIHAGVFRKFCAEIVLGKQMDRRLG